MLWGPMKISLPKNGRDIIITKIQIFSKISHILIHHCWSKITTKRSIFKSWQLVQSRSFWLFTKAKMPISIYSTSTLLPWKQIFPTLKMPKCVWMEFRSKIFWKPKKISAQSSKNIINSNFYEFFWTWLVRSTSLETQLVSYQTLEQV